MLALLNHPKLSSLRMLPRLPGLQVLHSHALIIGAIFAHHGRMYEHA